MEMGRRFEHRETGTTFRLVKREGKRALVARRGAQAQWVEEAALDAVFAAGLIVDVTDWRACPQCHGTMNREAECRIEWMADRVINGYTVRDEQVRKVAHKPVWFCTACEHVEEER